MKVPGYEDLTPGIPGVVDAETVDQLALFLDSCHRPASDSPGTRTGGVGDCALGPGNLYACLRRQTPHGLPTADCQLLTDVARDFSPRVRRASASEVLLDVSGLGRLIGPPKEIARQLAHALAGAGAAASVALGPTQTIARLLAHAETGAGRTLRHKDHDDHEAHQAGGPWQQLPVALLQELEVLPAATSDRDRARICETRDAKRLHETRDAKRLYETRDAKRLYEILERWGITTLGELAALPAADLASRLGRRGLALQRLARGLDPAPFVPDAGTPRYVGRLELEWPIDALEPLSFVFARLLEPLSADLERADRGAAAVRLELRMTDRSTHARVLQLPAAMRDARVLRTLLLLDLESSPPPSPLRGFGETSAVTTAVDVVTIELDPAPARITQFSLLQRALPSPETLATLTARLAALAGESRVGSPALLDSHRPDAFAMTRYAPEGAKSAKGADGAGANGAHAVLRRERRSVALHVSVEHGRPVHLASSRRGVPSGAIVEAAGPWRTSGEWWTPDRQWSRNEWDVALKSGAVCRIYQDRTADRWFLEGIYD